MKLYFLTFKDGGYSLVEDLSIVPEDIIATKKQVEDKKYSREELERMYANS